MTRTQIQLPDDQYSALKRLADSKEWSLAEAVRRAVELLLSAYPPAPEGKTWRFPEPVELGEPLLPVDDWRAAAHDR